MKPPVRIRAPKRETAKDGKAKAVLTTEQKEKKAKRERERYQANKAAATATTPVVAEVLEPEVEPGVPLRDLLIGQSFRYQGRVYKLVNKGPGLGDRAMVTCDTDDGISISININVEPV